MSTSSFMFSKPIAAGGDNPMVRSLPGGLLAQYPPKVANFSSQYGGNSKSYCAANLAGPPSCYPSYGDFTEAFVLRTYGSWWMRSPAAVQPITPHTPPTFRSQDFVEIEYEVQVFPTEIIIFETYNPGTVVRIMACNASSTSDIPASQIQWEELWSGPPQDQEIPRKQRKFKPPLRKIDFPTNLIRLEFNHATVDYYTELDAVELRGKKPDSSSKEKRHDRAWGFELGRTMTLLQKMSLSSRFGRQASIESCGEVDSLDNGYFDWLPDETIHLILSYLDVISLCRLAMTCRFLFHLSYDPMLASWRNLDLQPFWTKVDTVVLKGLEFRCKHLSRLSLSWTGGGLQITEEAFCKFIEACGSQLVCLRVACCQFIEEAAIATIVSVCQKLEELDLQACRLAGNRDGNVLMPLSNLKCLKSLNLYNTPVRGEELIAIIVSNSNLQHLNLGSCTDLIDCNKVLVQLAINCKGLLSLDLWRGRTLTSEGLDSFSEGCTKLQELDIGWTSRAVRPTSMIKLAERCPDLRKVFLTATRFVTDDVIRAIASNCPNLEQFDILGSNDVSADAVEYLLRRCPKLIFFDLSFCQKLDNTVVTDFRRSFQNVSIKKSFS